LSEVVYPVYVMDLDNNFKKKMYIKVRHNDGVVEKAELYCPAMCPYEDECHKRFKPQCLLAPSAIAMVPYITTFGEQRVAIIYGNRNWERVVEKVFDQVFHNKGAEIKNLAEIEFLY